jgi:pimeloyl-ACP methyl ester carboxylesterase
MYRMYLGVSTPSNPVHIFAIDYRGFGLSTGSPTEEGLITDGLTLLNFLTTPPLNIPPSRIVVVGLSLGTAVTSAVAERFAFGAPESALIQPAIKNPEPFAGIILLSSFSSIRSLIHSYSWKGFTPPMLSPLIGYPRAQQYMLDQILDQWDTAARVTRLTGEGPTAHNESDAVQANKSLDLTIVHARDDTDIPWREGWRVWQAAVGPTDEKGAPLHGSVVYERIAENGLTESRIWEKEVDGKGQKAVKKVRWEKVGYGGTFLSWSL